MKKITFLLLLVIPILGFSQVDLPITFEDPSIDYKLGDFGGNTSMIVVDPTDSTNQVGQATKDGPEPWAGTTVGGDGLDNPIPFTMGDTKMSVRVWSPTAGIPIRLKVENAADPGISVETEAMTTVAGEWEMLTFDFANQADGTAALNLANTYNKVSIFFDFGTVGSGQVYYWDDMMFIGGGGSDKMRPDLPITFEDTASVDYALGDFGGNSSMIVVDPTDSTNLVGQATKDGPEPWAGTTIGGNGLSNPVPFTMADTKMSVRVWSPAADIPVRLKAENAADAGISVETEAMTTVAGMWDTLTFDFVNQADGTAALNIANTYDKVSMFFDFGTVGSGQVYYWDDMMFIGGGGSDKMRPDLPITFEDTSTVDYALGDFGGNSSMIVVDPTDSTNLVGQATKDGPEPWAGTTIGGNGLASPVPFTMDDTKMSVRVWSPAASIPVRLKVENAADAGISAETEMMTSVAGAWDTLTFDFANQADGTAALNIANTYDKVSMFFDFGTVGSGQVYYWDDMMFVGGGGSDLVRPDLPITFEDTATVDYALGDFGGNSSMIVVDPTDSTNLVGQATKDGPEPWAGTTVGGNGLANPIPFTMTETMMSVRVWSPTADIPIRLKAENAADAGISVETEAMTTVAGEWQMLTFDFSSPAEGTAALDLANTYDKVSIFFDFGTVGSGQVYYLDDIAFIGSDLLKPDLPITFEDTSTVDYALGDFGGNSSMIVVDPTDASNLVGQATKDGPEPWAGTTVGGNGLDNPIPFTMTDSKMSVRVWSPTAEIPIRLKAENAADPGISVETEAMTTVAEQWETLTFDFSSPSEGTAALNLDNTYDKVSIFFDFGTVGTGQVYYWDDIAFLLDVGVDITTFEEVGIKVAPNPAQDFIFVDLPKSFTSSTQMNIYDVNGRLISQKQVDVNRNPIDVSDLSAGLYYLRINSENRTFIQNLLISK